MKKTLLILALMSASIAAHASDTTTPAVSLHPILEFGLTTGGDSFSVPFSDGSSQDVMMGGLVQVGGGLKIRANKLPIEGQITVSYHVDNVTDSYDYELKWDRVPVEVLGFYRFSDKLKLGGGLRFVSAGTLSESYGSYSDSIDSKSTTGLVLEGNYCPSGNASGRREFCFGLRYVNEKYDFGGAELDGSHVGIKMGYSF